MEIANSARKHGVADEDILHAFRNPLRIVAQSDRALFIGPARDATLLELVVLGEDTIIHADVLRPKFYDYLR